MFWTTATPTGLFYLIFKPSNAAKHNYDIRKMLQIVACDSSNNGCRNFFPKRT